MINLKRTLAISVIAALLAALMCACAPANAATISAPGFHVSAYNKNNKVDAYWPSDPVKCDLVLDGEIVEGDAASLKRDFEKIVGTFNSFSFFLCLRSGGGSTSEALKIAEFVLETQRPSIATVVEDGQTCASACALVFLAGNAPARKGAWPQRFLHPRARLLFHSSRVNLDKYSDDALLLYLTAAASQKNLKETVTGLYKSGLRDVQSIMSTFKKEVYETENLSGPWVPPSLFLEMFSQDPEEWVCVDTIDAIGRWNIQAFGYSPPKALSSQNYLNVCHSAYNWRLDRFVADDDSNDNDAGKIAVKTVKPKKQKNQDPEFDVQYRLPYQAPLLPLTCSIKVRYGDSGVLDQEADLEVSFEGGTALVSRLNSTAFFSAEKLLWDFGNEEPAKADAGAEKSFASYPNSQMNGCTFKNIKGVDEKACQSACSRDAMCAAYSHSKLTSLCELKHTLTARRLDPTRTSGVPSEVKSIESSREVRMKFKTLEDGKRLRGSVISSVKINDDSGNQGELCSSSCQLDSSCLAADIESGSSLCRKLSSVDGLTAAPANQAVDTYVKSQQ
ncbi:PAN domain-containing protein [Bradyrhizobium tropiciagri]|uniref:PAN domain-containing protein n=1 Tax=Bradyrhizobium tropiciagri TaxID=312253 RepID=UPI00067CCB18|nr:PAN domain-containing protein [Bradyrhizobium tropiciagri]